MEAAGSNLLTVFFGRTTLCTSSELMRRVRSLLVMGALGSLYPFFWVEAASTVPAIKPTSEQAIGA